MKMPSNPKFIKTLFSVWVLFLISIFLLNFQSFEEKNKNQHRPLEIRFVVDWNDISQFSVDAKQTPQSLLNRLAQLPIHQVSLSVKAQKSIENKIRKSGFKILWRIPLEPMNPVSEYSDRWESGDTLLAYETNVVGYPSYLDSVARVVENQNLKLVRMEFAAQKGWSLLASKAPQNTIKGHTIQAKEVIHPKPQLWKARLVRAVRERGVSMLYVRWSPAMSIDENIQLVKDVINELKTRGFKS